VTKKIAGTGIAAIMLASTAIAGSTLPAQAQPGRDSSSGFEYVTEYYSNSQLTTIVGYYEFGCAGTYRGGSTSSYIRRWTLTCSS
jgi:hypothetical protein